MTERSKKLEYHRDQVKTNDQSKVQCSYTMGPPATPAPMMSFRAVMQMQTGASGVTTAAVVRTVQQQKQGHQLVDYLYNKV